MNAPKGSNRPASKLTAAKKAAAAKAKAKKTKAPEVTEIPEFVSDDVLELEINELLMVEEETPSGRIVTKPIKLSRKDFPKSRDGKLAFADYMISMWVWRKADWEKKSDPNAKKAARVDRLRAQLAKLEAELSGEADDGEE